MNICVVGAGGAIGSRLVKRLYDEQYKITAVVRTLSSAIRIGRYPINIKQLDIHQASQSELNLLFKDIDFVIDCSFSKNPIATERVNESVEMARKIASAAQHAGVKKLIHYGTISVYPASPQLTIDESTVCTTKNDSYADSKLAAENTFLELAENASLPVVVLQLPVVYGPFMNWSIIACSSMFPSQFVIPDDITGSCSPIHVDDVVEATCLTLHTEKANGQRILLASNEEISWSTYFESFRNAYSKFRIRLTTREEIKLIHEKQYNQSKPFRKLKSAFFDDANFRQLILSQIGIRHVYQRLCKTKDRQGVDWVKQKIIPKEIASTEQEQFIDAILLKTMDQMPGIDSDKAEQLLGFRPSIPLNQGIADTMKWLQWARLVK